MTVLDGIKGVANDVTNLTNISSLPQKLAKLYRTFVKPSISKNTTPKELTDELTGNKNQRIISNIDKLVNILKVQNINFDESGCVFNVVTKKDLTHFSPMSHFYPYFYSDFQL